MHTSSHARHNIFAHEPVNARSKKSSKGDVRKVSFDDRASTPAATAAPSTALARPPSTGSLPGIDFNVRQKLAMQDLSVKFSNKSQTFNVATNFGTSLESKRSAIMMDNANNILNSMYAFDDEDHSISKASQISSNTRAKGRSSVGSHRTTGQQHGQQGGGILPDSYFFNESQSVVEVSDEEQSQAVAEEDDISVVQPHPKRFQSPLDAHRSFMKASQSKNTLKSIQSLGDVRSLPVELIAQESRKAIVSMKIASRRSSPPRSAKSTHSATASSKFFFLTNLTGSMSPTISEGDEEQDEVLGQRAPLESTKAPIVQRPLLNSTYSRFNSSANNSTNNATLLRSMDSTKQSMKQADLMEDGEEQEHDTDEVVKGSLYHIPSLGQLTGKNLMKTVDKLIAKWTMLPAPVKPKPPPPRDPERMTAQSLFGEHLIKADLSKAPPEEEFKRLLSEPVVKTRPIPALVPAPAGRPAPRSDGSVRSTASISLPTIESPAKQAIVPAVQTPQSPAFSLPAITSPAGTGSRKLLVPTFSAANSTMGDYFTHLDAASQDFMANFLGDDNQLFDVELAPHPLRDEGLVYQHSTTSYVPDYTNQSALGFDYQSLLHPPQMREHRPSDLFSERHLAAIAGHSVGMSEPVIYLPPDPEPPVIAEETVDEDGSVHITALPSLQNVLMASDVLRPGYVLSSSDYPDLQSKMLHKHKDNILFYEGNIFDEQEDIDEDEEEEQFGSLGGLGQDLDQPASAVLDEYMTYLQSNEVDVSSFYTNYHPPSSTPQRPAHAHAHSGHMDHGYGHMDDNSPAEEEKALHSPASALDMRDEIMAFLAKTNSPMKDEYEEYFGKSTGHRPTAAQQMAINDDTSTIASEASYAGPMVSYVPAGDGDGHEKLWQNLQHRYSKDTEGQFQMQLKVKKYLKEGVRDKTQIRSQYDDQDDWDAW